MNMTGVHPKLHNYFYTWSIAMLSTSTDFQQACLHGNKNTKQHTHKNASKQKTQQGKEAKEGPVPQTRPRGRLLGLPTPILTTLGD